MIDGSLGVTDGVVGVQATMAAVGSLTIHDMEPAGLNPPEPVTIAVSVVVPPKVGEDDALIEIVGTSVEIPSVTVLELTEV
jgi:hypothetical protein